MRTAIVILAVVFGLAGCASTKSIELVQMPQRDADLYPWAQQRAGVVLAVDEIVDPARLRQYFGVDLLKENLLPVSVIVSNHSQHRVAVRPSDILLMRGRTVVDPVPTERVAAIVKDSLGRLHSETEQNIEKHLRSLALQEATLAPNESYQGLLFFPQPQPKERNRLFTVLSLFREGGLRMHVGLTNLDTGERLQFGPFTLSTTADLQDFLPISRRSGY